jgi:hypothetical protein
MAIAQIGTWPPLGSVRFAMADTTKLSVGKALEKLRGTDEPKSKRHWW